MLTVVALGGNALLRRGEPLDAALQRANVKIAAEAIAEIALDHRLVVTHGNGPQVGLLALQNEAYEPVAPYPLDVLDAETEGMVGYLLEQELGRHIDRGKLAALLTQVIVDEHDPAFANPTKFVGPMYDERDARFIAHERGWAVGRDGDGWRRVVPSPQPKQIVEIDTIRLLVDHGVTVICSGGGGIPVITDPVLGMRGIEAVIDKDLTAALLATSLGADALVLLTDVDAVYADWGGAAQRAIRDTTIDEIRSLPLPAGSMGPKVEAICRFVEQGGRLGAIGSLDDAAAIVRGEAGTILRGSDR
jgi:carbamate kinase